jgi:hypothetical protein
MSLPSEVPPPAVQKDVVQSSFDDPDRIDYHPVPDYDPVPDRGPITHSSFDDEDRTDRHPVP